MEDTQTQKGGVLADIAEHLSGIFRHMLPGILVVGGTRVAYPEWFAQLDLTSWQHIVVLGVITIAVGNTWFALNRYGFHQLVDYILYQFKSKGPARESGIMDFTFLDDLGKYTYKSLHTGGYSARARQHVAFRASTVLLILTVGELALVFAFFHSMSSRFEGKKGHMIVTGLTVLLFAVWQMIITRRIDYYVVNPDDAA